MDSTLLMEKIKKIVDDRKGRNIEVIDVRDVTVVTDYFLIVSGTSTTHVRSLADEVQSQLEQEGIKAAHIEGYESCSWIVLDYLGVVVHVFLDREREYYNIERLWRTGGTYRAAAPIATDEDVAGRSFDAEE